MTIGYIYVLTNESMPGLVKIGCTAYHPTERMRQLFSTGVPTPFILEYHAQVENHKQAERKVHARMRDIRENKEFFRCDAADAIALIENLDIQILSREIRPQVVASADKKTQTFRDKEAAKVEFAKQQQRIYEEEARERQKTSMIADKLIKWIGLPVGLLAAFFTAQVVPSRLGGFGSFILSLVAGSTTGLFVASVAGNIFNSFRKTHTSRTNPSLKSVDLPVSILSVKNSASESAKVTGKGDGIFSKMASVGSRLKWWHLLFVPLIFKLIDLLLAKNN